MRDGKVLAAKTLKNDSFLPDRPVWEKAQDVRQIVTVAMQAVNELRTAYPEIERIGLTGQQHGIVYLDGSGTALSPLYIWQDGRGDLPYDDSHSYASYLTELTGYPLATGYGLVTHFYNLKNGRKMPKPSAPFTIISPYCWQGRRLRALTPATPPASAFSIWKRAALTLPRWNVRAWIRRSSRRLQKRPASAAESFPYTPPSEIIRQVSWVPQTDSRIVCSSTSVPAASSPSIPRAI